MKNRANIAAVKKVMTVKEVSAYLQVHPSTIYQLSKNRELPAFRIGSAWRFNIEAVDRWRLERGSGASIAPRRYGNVIPFRKPVRLHK